MKDHANMGLDTTCIHAGQEPDKLFGGVSVPIYQSSTFAFENAAQGAARFSGEDDGFKYTRLGNPTIAALEEAVYTLENGNYGVATATGMAAISTVLLTFLSAGKHAVATGSVYGPTRTFLENELARFGVESTFVNSSVVANVKNAIKENTALIYIETPANPTLSITDIEACAKIAKEAGIMLVVDNTFCSPVLQKPLNLGADIVLHSMSKYINGHSDVIAGIVVCKDEALIKQMRRVLAQVGGTMDPHQAWLVLRGIKSLGLRVNAGQANAKKLAVELEKHPKVEWVKYPGLASHPQHELAKKQMTGPGAMISFVLKGGVTAGKTVMDSVSLCTLGVSLGGIETLIQHPASMTHSCMDSEARKSAGIDDGLVRLAVGCESYEDLQKDIMHALDQI